MTSDIVTHDVIHDSDLWDGEHHVTSLSSYFGYLENDAKVLASSVLCIARFIQKHPIGSRPIEQFPPILGAGSIMWHLFQTVSAVGWDRFKVLPQPDSPSLVEAMRTLYGPNLPQEPSLDNEMAVDQPAVEEAPFTTVLTKRARARAKSLLLLITLHPLRTCLLLLQWCRERLPHLHQPRQLLLSPPPQRWPQNPRCPSST